MDAIATDSLYDCIRLISWVLVTAASGDYASTAAFFFYVLITTRTDVITLNTAWSCPISVGVGSSRGGELFSMTSCLELNGVEWNDEATILMQNFRAILSLRFSPQPALSCCQKQTHVLGGAFSMGCCLLQSSKAQL